MSDTYQEGRQLTDADVEYVYVAAGEWFEHSGPWNHSDADRRRFQRYCASYAQSMDTMDVHFPSMFRVWS